ncbi:hypothetical protein PCO82_05915 [Pectobacteriaceae bacterium CE90]|nr:hypothetical protein PCO82_05915 [Pectobacteriaceae bacterium CE90]
MKRISPERKASVLAKLLPPYNMTVAMVAQREVRWSLDLCQGRREQVGYIIL